MQGALRSILGITVLTLFLGAVIAPLIMIFALPLTFPALEPRLCEEGASLVLDAAPYPETGRSLYCRGGASDVIVRSGEFTRAAVPLYLMVLFVVVWLPLVIRKLKGPEPDTYDQRIRNMTDGEGL
ncbi:hypothetical protein [Qipengyuania sphaerica]|uniref:hypothetical protein n=1 Tax=Qipengyuania sphaerica TaxID=2867243 RepID=UPI001C89BD7E|nr:hypothetical protein [Qipengyuania sphaerica]MBX7542037.1 hypothetical protein [Qipengyuania sphaerica]